MNRILFCLSMMLALFTTDCYAYVRYVTENLNMRYGPSTEYAIIGVIPKGTAVTIDEDCDCKWIPIEYCGYIGYVSTRYLSSNNPRQNVSKKENKSYTYSPSTTYSIHRSNVKHYTNVDGYRVQSPTRYSSTPAGATALCRDGTYSFSRNRRGTCSHHGGVARWL